MIILIVGTLHASLRMPAVPVLLIMHFKYRENHKDALFCILVSGSAFLILLASYFLPFPGNSQAHVLTAEFPCLLTYSIPVWGADLTGETTFTSILLAYDVTFGLSGAKGRTKVRAQRISVMAKF